MVIFGEGASYDCDPGREPKNVNQPDRPPLSDNLFEKSDIVNHVISAYPRCRPVIPHLRRISARGDSVEQVLETLLCEAARDGDRHCQLAAIRFYLARMLSDCGASFYSGAQGVTTMQRCSTRSGNPKNEVGPTLVVTVNYDTILDRALGDVGVPITKLEHYISSDRFKLIKIHGSVNWVREVDDLVPGKAGTAVYEQVIDQAANLRPSDRWRLVDGFATAHTWGDKAIMPALAIPVQTRQAYECPADHLEEFRRLLPRVDKLLVIGWRAKEQTFLQLLAESLQSDLRGMVVSGNETESSEVALTGSKKPASKGGSKDHREASLT